jgi:hypothetical protein
LAEGLVSWVSGQPNVAAQIKRAAGIKGDIDHFGASSFIAGVLAILRDSGYKGLMLVIDEVETLQRMRADTREKGLNGLRQWIDEIDAGRFPGLYLMITEPQPSTMARKESSAWRPWRSACMLISARKHVSTIPVRCKSACRILTLSCFRRSAAGFATSTPKVQQIHSEFAIRV